MDENFREEDKKQPIGTGKDSILEKIGNKMGKAIENMDNFGSKLENVADSFANKSDKLIGNLFEKALTRAGFNLVCIEWMKLKIKSVDAKILLAMDNILNKTQEKNMEKGEMDNGGR